ncbi:hypothetical protein LEP1GSC043_4873 [Leptospira weilii str. Ecochallenge]|uniref:Uncharacterized protein n=1 Tax=Leptospira weilii str. Ecochallenge TaxID=1049986 RepID=N1TYA6_9LEPT|nr:hypothetical protein LEP1GSC043_4873 [Leptospira weilii str. Ecochallenge]
MAKSQFVANHSSIISIELNLIEFSFLFSYLAMEKPSSLGEEPIANSISLPTGREIMLRCSLAISLPMGRSIPRIEFLRPRILDGSNNRLGLERNLGYFRIRERF